MVSAFSKSSAWRSDMPTDYRPSESSYILDSASGAEIARLHVQHSLFTGALGYLIPPEIDLTNVETILDIGSGSGSWAIETAYAFQDRAIVGIDISSQVVGYARARAVVQRVENVSFRVMDACKPLEFAEGSFDLIHIRFASGFLHTCTWPLLLKECFRVLTAGGILLLTECELGISNSLALQQLNGFLFQVLQKEQRTFSVDGQTLGVSYMFNSLLQEAGFQTITNKPFMLNFSSSTPSDLTTIKELELTFEALRPYILRFGLVDEKTYKDLCVQMLQDLLEERFVCISLGLTAWGYKGECAGNNSR